MSKSASPETLRRRLDGYRRYILRYVEADRLPKEPALNAAAWLETLVAEMREIEAEFEPTWTPDRDHGNG